LVAKATIEVKRLVKKDKEEEQALLDAANEALKLVPRGRPLGSQSQEKIIASLDGGVTGTGYAGAEFKVCARSEPTQEKKSAKKSNGITKGATSRKRQESPEKIAHGPLEKLVYEALEKLALFVISCGGKRDLLEGWSARRNTSGGWLYYSKEGTLFQSRPEVARRLNLPGAPKAEQRKFASDEPLEKLASYLVSCGGTRDLADGWSAKRVSGQWHYYPKEGTKFFESRADVARWLKLPGVSKLEQRTIENTASQEECNAYLEKLVTYVISCGGKRDSLEGWSARRYGSGTWGFVSKEGIGFKCRPDVARWLNLPGAPAVQRVQRFSPVSMKRKSDKR
jgi:hypothetical protein